MRVPRWCWHMKALPLVLFTLTTLNARAADPWDPAYGYRVPSRQTPSALVGGSGEAYAAGMVPTGPPSGTSPPGLYEKLRSNSGLGSVQPGGRATSVTSPGSEPRGYRFRGDGPVERGDPPSTSDYRYRPLTAQERDRGQETSGWRPLSAPRQDSPSAPIASSYPDRQSGGWTRGLPPDAGMPGMPINEPENWFERNYRRAGDGGR